MACIRRNDTFEVFVGGLKVGGEAPIRVQSMTNTDTADIDATVAQIRDLAASGSEMVRVTVNTMEAARAVASIRQQLSDSGIHVPLVGDFHYNGHKILSEVPECAQSLDKYRINPGNVGAGKRREDNFEVICRLAAEHGKPVRIGVNGGSLDQDLVMKRMQENTDKQLGLTSQEILNTCMIESALDSTARALDAGLTENQIIISCKVSNVQDLIAIYRELSQKTKQPLHLGLTEAGMGSKGIVASSAAMGILLQEGIGDTIRISLTPEPGGDRCREVKVAQELLQSLGLRAFSPDVTACPGCGRTTSTVFQELAQDVEAFLEIRMPEWKQKYEGVEGMKLAVMGCIVNGPGESKTADIGISLPGTGEEPKAPVYINGSLHTTLKGNREVLTTEFCKLVEDYVQQTYSLKDGQLTT